MTVESSYEYISDPPIFADIGISSFIISNAAIKMQSSPLWINDQL